MSYQPLLAQSAPPARDSSLNVSHAMGRIVGVLIIAIVVIWIVQKLRGKK